MSRFHSYLSSAIKIISSYKKGEPFNFHLKQFFSENKKYGSRDRKQIASLCYGYFRCAHLFEDFNAIETVILKALFLCNHSSNEILAQLKPELNEKIDLNAEEKIKLLNINQKSLFNFSEDLSDSIDLNRFALSMFKQPSLFLRIRPGCKEKVADKLTRNQTYFEVIGDDSIKCNNAVKIDEVLLLNKEVVVQDLNSQRVFDFLKQNKKGDEKTLFSVWDTCAASGGKSILIHDVLKGKVKITASDIRENILSNYTYRLQSAGINIYRKFIQDLSVSSGLMSSEKFDIIVCDAPCTGSGTWSRNPEQYFSFEKNTISVFSKKQKEIVSHTIPHLQKNGFFFYITCSVFKSENEEIVNFIRHEHQLNLINQSYLKGYDDAADTMFVAIFQL